MKIRFFLFLVFSFLCYNCSQSVEEEFQKIESKSKEALLNKDKKKIVKFLENLEALEQRETKDKISQIAKIENQNIKLYYLNPSLNYFIFYDDNKINFFYNNKIYDYKIPRPNEIISSYYGKYVLFRYKDSSCKNIFMKAIPNEDNKIQFTTLREFFDSCEPLVITDTSKIFFYNSNGIYEKNINELSNTLVIPINQIKKRFKKNQPRVIFYPIPDKGFWFFYGLAGYYDIYYYDEKVLKLIYQGAASPKVFYAISELFSGDGSAENIYFVYTGASAQYSFTGFQLPDQLLKSFNIPVKKNYTYIAKQNQFLYLEENNLYLFNPVTLKEIHLPIYAEEYFIFRDSLIFIFKENIYQRKEGFSNLEKKIFALREELIYNLR